MPPRRWYYVSIMASETGDPLQAMDKSAHYTLLGFVEHMGTMRSGHYVAYVQRGLSVSDSPHLQSLLHKHGIGSPPITDQPNSSSALASSKGKRKGAARASLSPKVGAGQKEDASSGNAMTNYGRVSASGKRSSEAGSGSAGPSSSALAAEDSNDQQNSNDSSQSIGDATASDNVVGFSHTNGHAQPQHSIPHDWESGDNISANEALQAASSIPAKQANGTHLQTNAALGASVSTSDTVAPAQELHEILNGAGQQGSSSEESARSGEASTSQAQECAQVQAAGPDGKSTATKKGKSCTIADVSQQEKRAWYYISDTQVKAVTEADVLSREAYILLYMRTA